MFYTTHCSNEGPEKIFFYRDYILINIPNTEIKRDKIYAQTQ